MTLKNRLKELRAREKMSQQELADKSGVSRQMISLIERGKVEPSIVVALKLSRVFDEKTDDIFSIF
ncbi:MAG: helix-turn-helix transcriptional regulator [Streptococcus orisratti]|uniref:helix-turn-helix transcriptional regulator n=1 Tax=Streptococcus orisratti TaxID=114652 RepID=UPI002A90D8CE|nr:helix-turn-helix transcriptional regulator [Streptococcus orisratti]MDY5635421.1 helix-turn-helix transcriptional regulator [Streptococcus orisratti]